MQQNEINIRMDFEGNTMWMDITFIIPDRIPYLPNVPYSDCQDSGLFW
jgi:hypothetical protein